MKLKQDSALSKSPGGLLYPNAHTERPVCQLRNSVQPAVKDDVLHDVQNIVQARLGVVGWVKFDLKN